MARRPDLRLFGDGHALTPAPESAALTALPPRDAAGQERRLVAFDFDGTLTVRDSFTAFLRWRTGLRGALGGLARLLPELVLYPLLRDRGRLKAATVRVFLAGLTRAELEAQAGRFATEAAAGLFRPDALAAWTAHGAAGARRIIVTASPEETVAPFAEHLGAEGLIGTRLDWTADGRAAGGLDGANCRGAEKVRRLKARFGEGVALADAYGDTSGDREMLALAERGHMRLFTGRPARIAPLSRASASPSRRT